MAQFWESKHWEESDYQLKRLRSMPFQRRWPKIPTQAGIFFIRGPRQIGKSSFLKAILSYHAKIDPKSIGYLTCDEIETHSELRVSIEPYFGRKILLLDEISFVKEWWRVIKALADQGVFNTIIITGSNTWDIKQGADLLPGRWGEGGEIELLPMDFNEFEEAYLSAGYEKVSREELIKRYLWTGGFPITLAETQGNYIKPIKTIDTIKRWLLGDAIKLGKNEKYLRDLLHQVSLTQQTPLSLQKLSQKSQIGSHHTAIDYVDLMESTFCLKTLYAYDVGKKIFQYKKDKKFYFRDPIYFHLASDWANIELPDDFFEKAAEASAFEFLHRHHKTLGFLHTQKGEVDFIVPGKMAVEVKWSNRALPILSKTYKELLIGEKKVWQPHNFFM